METRKNFLYVAKTTQRKHWNARQKWKENKKQRRKKGKRKGAISFLSEDSGLVFILFCLVFLQPKQNFIFPNSTERAWGRRSSVVS